MSTANLSNLNVDTLFEQHGVPEIDIIQKKIQAVVEKKREELRTMVGERYRDLLKAADTIAAMKESSSTLIAQCECITANCRSLNEQQLIGFKVQDTTEAQHLRQRAVNKQVDKFFSTMIQIKILTALPELIWMNIDREHFLTATELFIFSRHISTGLQLDAGNALMQKLPVAMKQWEILKPFHMTLKQSMLAVLEREDLTAEVAVNCLLGLILLEKSNLNAVFKQFLHLRGTAFASCLSDADASRGLERRRVKDCILASLRILNSTMELMWRCFIGDGLIFEKLASHTEANALPTIALMDSNDAQCAHLLPDIIANFRPTFEPQQLDEDQLRTALDQWLTEIRRIAGIQLKALFSQVHTMSTIQEIKSEANLCRQHHNFAPIVERFKLQHNLNFYERKYMPLINQRVHDIIEKRWTEAVRLVLEEMRKALQDCQVPPSAGQMTIWTESTADLPLSLEAALSDVHSSKKLLMKTKGYDHVLIELFANFDRNLAEIVTEVNVLLGEQSTRPEDKLALIEFLRETAQQQVHAYISEVKSFNLSCTQRRELLFVVRSCTALVELCPHLRSCFCPQGNWRQWLGQGTSSNLESWNHLCGSLTEEALHFWSQIVDGILEENKCAQQLPDSITHDVALQDFTLWETVNVDQRDEQGNSVASKYRIPSQPRISLQSYLFRLIAALDDAIPETLPPKMLVLFNHKLLTQLLAHYRHLSAPLDSQPNQNVALQLFFDLKFLQAVFAPSREERALSDELQALQNVFKDQIDPFDFELFVEHIGVNVKRAVTRLRSLIGVLVPQSVLSSSTNISMAPSVAQEMDPNVLNLCSSGSTSLWFPLLPIITAQSQAAAAAAASATSFQAHKVAASSAEAEKPSSPSKKSGSSRKGEQKTKSFFGAMSQEWFR